MPDNIVWEATVDQGAWLCRVTGGEAYRGTLTITRSSDGKVIHTQPVGLSYDALFGPDIADVAEWQVICIERIDAHEDV